jgi:hypothetical protein
MALLPVSALLDWSPFDHYVWDITRPVTKDAVGKAIAENRFRPVPLDLNTTLEMDMESRTAYHIERIAHLVQAGWEDEIDVDVGVPALGYHPDWIVQDGNHRLAAAIYRGDESIAVSVAGQLDFAAALFGVEEARLAGEPGESESLC